MLPLSPFHVLLGWVDIITDVCSIYSTAAIAQRTEPLCGHELRGFFGGCFVMQLALLLGNLTSQSILAMQTAAATGSGSGASDEEEGSDSKRPVSGCATKCGRILAAGVRGFFGLELGYQEWRRRQAPTTAEACIYYKMVELVFEAPQVVLAWVVLLMRAIIQNAKQGMPGQHEQEFPAHILVFQFTGALFGLVSLSLPGWINYICAYTPEASGLPLPQGGFTLVS
jgi:hypothetical protein